MMNTFWKVVAFVIFSYSLLLRPIAYGNEEPYSGSERFLSTMLANILSQLQIPGLSQITSGTSSIEVSLYNLFTSFVNQTRQTIPDIAHHGNFTLIQLGLLCAIGAMAAGAATIVAEGFIFRQQQTDLENYNAHLHNHRISFDPSADYGSPDSPPSSSLTYNAGDSHVIYTNTVPSSANSYKVGSSYYNSKTKHRKKRDTGQKETSFLNQQIVKAYSVPLKKTNLKKGFIDSSQLPQFQFNQQSYNIPSLKNNRLQISPYQVSASSLNPNLMPYLGQFGGRWKTRKQNLAASNIDSDIEYSRRLPVSENRYRSNNNGGQIRKNRIKQNIMYPNFPDNPEIRYRSPEFVQYSIYRKKS